MDHFNASSRATFLQKYYVNDVHFDGYGPIFFYFGGESGIHSSTVTDEDETFVSSGIEANALLVSLEHRFYGESLPFNYINTSYSRGLLTSRQALEDAAALIRGLKKNYTQSGPVIVFGGSYPGSLAAWFRSKYPDLAWAAIASSAPLVATVDLTEYLDVVDFGLEDFGGKECDTALRVAMDDFSGTVLPWTNTTYRLLQDYFSTCDTPESILDVAALFEGVIGEFMGVAQYNDEEEESSTSPDLNDLCKIMEDESLGSELTRFLYIYKKYILEEDNCENFSYSAVANWNQEKTSNLSNTKSRPQFLWQRCNEFGWFQSTDSPRQPFGSFLPLGYFLSLCRDVFGIDGPDVNATNAFYGGRDIVGSRILFVNGNIDPWSSMSITESTNPDLPAIFINGTAHCADMTHAQPWSPPSLAIAQAAIKKQLMAWVADGFKAMGR